MEENEPSFEKMSDEELRAYIAGASSLPLATALDAASKRQELPPAADRTHGMGPGALFLEGAKREVMKPITGAKELATGLFGTKREVDEYNAAKREQLAYDRDIMSNLPARMGSLGVQALGAAALPARLAPQVLGAAGAAALAPTQSEISGAELPTRAVQAVTAGAPTYLAGKALGALGQGIGAATGRFTPEGEEALRLNEMAKRLKVNRSLGSLDPSSELAAFETKLPSYARAVEQQTKAFTDAAKVTKDIPSSTGKSFESRTLEGEKLRSAIAEAGQNLEGVGRSLWQDLDSYIVHNNIPGVAPKNSTQLGTQLIQKYTPITNKGMQLDQNPVLQRITDYDPDAAQLLTSMIKNPSQPLAFADMHKLQSAVGKAMGRAEKDAAAPNAPLEARQMRTELKNLYGSLMSDVDAWGTKNPGAHKMFEDAKTFWRDAVVPGVMTNKVYRKAAQGVYGMSPRGYSEPRALYSDVVGNPRAMQDLYPYMSQEGRDLGQTLATMPDMARALTTNRPHPSPQGLGMLTTLAGLAIGSPLQTAKGALSRLPVAESQAAKNWYFGRDVLHNSPLGRVAWAASQVPQELGREKVQRLWRGEPQ